jgi:hypothetical protein
MSSTGRQSSNSCGEDCFYASKRRQDGNVDTHSDLVRGRESADVEEVVIAIVRCERNAGSTPRSLHPQEPTPAAAHAARAPTVRVQIARRAAGWALLPIFRHSLPLRVAEPFGSGAEELGRGQIHHQEAWGINSAADQAGQAHTAWRTE